MRTKPIKWSGREDYFAVNCPGLRTIYRVSGRLGELARRFDRFDEASADAKRLNRAYNMGLKHGIDSCQDWAREEQSS